VLDDALRRAGIRRQTTFITNAVKCRPPANRRPQTSELAACRPYLLAQIAAVRPRVVVALGLTAVKDLLDRSMPLAAARRSRHFLAGTPVIATYHPAAVLRNRRLLPNLVGDLRKARRRAEGS
jgi:DNA polymerase